MVTVIWVTRCIRMWMRDMGYGELMEILLYFCCCCIGNPATTLRYSFPLRNRLLKACIRLVTWTFPILGDSPELAGYESDFDNNTDGWYDCRARRYA